MSLGPFESRDERYERLSRAIAGERLPCVLVDLRAFDENAAALERALWGSGKTHRVTTKSFRVPALLERLLARPGGTFRGLQCMHAREAALLAARGLDDLVVAYPSLEAADLDLLARASREGKRLSIVIDDPAQADALAAAAARAGVRARAWIDLDVSYRPGGGLHLGVRRSPIRTPEAALTLAREARERGVEVVGLMGYEAHVAGVPDRDPPAPGGEGASGALGRRLHEAALALYKRLALPRASDLRARTLALLRAEGFSLEHVNGGGTGTLESAARDPALTETSAGSFFLGSHIHDRFLEARPRPACFFALPIVRRPDPSIVTCLGGGWVASGAAGAEKLPLPWLPEGLSLLPGEGAGEVQTPLALPKEGRGARLRPGEPVFFRHAKAGEVMERVPEALLIEGERIVARAPTYRGLGEAFV
jgi:D-serine deaminase-like pyridoxal phosphate-dependent protein